MEATSGLVVSNKVNEHTGHIDSNNNNSAFSNNNIRTNEMQANTPVAIDINNSEIKKEQIFQNEIDDEDFSDSVASDDSSDYAFNGDYGY